MDVVPLVVMVINIIATAASVKAVSLLFLCTVRLAVFVRGVGIATIEGRIDGVERNVGGPKGSSKGIGVVLVLVLVVAGMVVLVVLVVAGMMVAVVGTVVVVGIAVVVAEGVLNISYTHCSNDG